MSIEFDHSAPNTYKPWPHATEKAILQTKLSKFLGKLLLVKMIGHCKIDMNCEVISAYTTVFMLYSRISIIRGTWAYYY